MSELSSLEQTWNTNLSFSYAVTSSAALTAFDYLLTLHLELSEIWTGKLNIVKFLFVANRYSFYLAQIVTLFGRFFSVATDAECSATDIIASILTTCSAIAISAIFALRAFAVYDRSYTVLVILGIITSVFVASGLWQQMSFLSIAMPANLQVGPYRCVIPSGGNRVLSIFDTTEAYNIYLSVSLLNLISSLVFDSVVVTLTVARLRKTIMQLERFERSRTDIGSVLACDGIFYYCVIFPPEIFIAIIGILVLCFDKYNSLYAYYEDGSQIIATLQSIMTSRLILNLSNTAHTRYNSNFLNETGADQPVFFQTNNSILGNIGAPLRIEDEQNGEYGEEVSDLTLIIEDFDEGARRQDPDDNLSTTP